jgi:antirestriction protein ArdC
VTLQSSEGYAKEELTAEICAAMLACHAGITPAAPDNSAAYVAAWLKALQNDRSLIFAAASQAQKAFDYILGNAEESENNIPTEVRATGTDGAGDIAATIEAPKPRVTKQRASEYIDLL